MNPTPSYIKTYRQILLATCLLLFSVLTANASDTTGALVIIPIGGAAVGLLLGGIICFVVSRKERRLIWLALPAFPVLGFILALCWLRFEMSAHEDKIVASFGNYDRLRGGMGVISIPDSFSTQELERFYTAINDKNNATLASHKYAVALIHQANGIRQVYLNAYPNLDMSQEYARINDEVHKQMDKVLASASGKPK